MTWIFWLLVVLEAAIFAILWSALIAAQRRTMRERIRAAWALQKFEQMKELHSESETKRLVLAGEINRLEAILSCVRLEHLQSEKPIPKGKVM